MSSPNSSFLWVKYMAFQLSLAEFDQARAVAERALKSIHFREEKEKFTIWYVAGKVVLRIGTSTGVCV